MQIRTSMKAIRAKCLDCCCYQPKEVRLCTVKTCPLWPFRMGKRPKKEASQELVTVDGKG
jgi:hypothetical protein